MIEIAICLAIIGFALVAIIGVLPYGMNTQRDNRQATIIGQDASMLLETIRSGSRHADDLTNYVYAVTNEATGFGYDQKNLTGARIVGLLSTPGAPGATGPHIVAYVRSMSGLVAEKPPQDNSIMVSDTFSYRVACVNYPVSPAGSSGLAGNQHELRMTFLWPQLPNGSYGNGRQTFRATIAGQMIMTNDNGQALYFYQSQSFTNANAP